MMLRTKSAPVGRLYILREPVGTPDGTMMPGIYKVFGDLPKMLQPHAEPFTGQEPVGVRKLDAAKFAAALERHAQGTSAPQPPAKLTRDELAAARRWPTEALELLDQYGFPRPIGTRVTKDGRPSSLYRVDYVDRWIAGLGELARMLRAR